MVSTMVDFMVPIHLTNVFIGCGFGLGWNKANAKSAMGVATQGTPSELMDHDVFVFFITSGTVVTTCVKGSD